MKIVKYCDRELTEKENDLINHFTYYVASKDPFCIISDNSVIVLKNDEIDGKTDDEIKEYALDNIDEMLSSQPDFTSFIMDDGYGLVSMMNGIFGITEMLGEKVTEDDEIELGTVLEVRGNILDACENNGVLALVKPE